MNRGSLILTITMALTLLPATWFDAFAQKGRMTIDAGSGSGAGFSSGLIGITAGQVARLSVWNSSDKAVAVWLLFIDGDDKILITCNGIVSPGHSLSDQFTNLAGNDRIELRGEIQADDQGGSDMLVPSLQLIDDQTSKTAVAFGPCDFRRIKLGD